MKRLSFRTRVALVASGGGALAALVVGAYAAGVVAGSGEGGRIMGAAAGIALLAGAAGWLAAGRIAAPVGRLGAAGARVIAGDLSVRVSTVGPPEIEHASEAINRLAGRLQELLQVGGYERVRLSSVLNTMTDGVLVVDDEGIVELANPAALAMLDVPAGFRPGDRLVTLNRDHEVLRVIMECAAEGQPRHGQVELLGSRRFLSVVAVPLTEGVAAAGIGRDRSLALVLLSDLTEMRRIENTRTEFVSNASHELRTPLAVIRASAETLEMGALEDREAAAGFLQRIGDNIGRMDRIIGDMLELSRLESGEAPMHLIPLDLGELAAGEVEQFRPLADRVGVAVDLEREQDLPLLTADPEKVSQILSNLLANALNATGHGGRVRVTVGRVPGQLRLVVSDTGRGIETEHLPHVFERFYKADPSRTHGGSGLGLAISKHIAQAHGAEINAESRPGEGATFTVAFPLPTGFDPRPEEASAEHGSEAGGQ